MRKVFKIIFIIQLSLLMALLWESFAMGHVFVELRKYLCLMGLGVFGTVGMREVGKEWGSFRIHRLCTGE